MAQTPQDVSFSSKQLNFAGQGSVDQTTSLEFGPDGRLYVTEVDGDVKAFTIQRDEITGEYNTTGFEYLSQVKSIPNHNDDGNPGGNNSREVTGITVVGTASNPVLYVTSSDSRIGGGGGGGDTNLDTNSGVITRLTWNGSSWDVVDIVRGLPRSEENHAPNGLEFATINGTDYLIVSIGGLTNAGSPSNNFAFITEYALSAAVIYVNLGALEQMQIKTDPNSNRQYIYDLPTLDDPTRPNVNGIVDPNAPGYDGVDVGDPWGGNDGLNMAMLVPNSPVGMFSPGYRNSYDLVVTESGALYVTDNGANNGWGGYPFAEADPANVDNRYRVGNLNNPNDPSNPKEPGSNGPDVGTTNNEPKVNNSDHLNLVTTNIQNYVFGSVYGGHPTPVRANPNSGLYTRGTHTSDPQDTNQDSFTDGYFRTQPYDPNGSGDAANPNRALPANWPPVDISLINGDDADFRMPGGNNPDGPQDIIVADWGNNTNGIDEYTASNFSGALQGGLIAGKSGGGIHFLYLNPDGSLSSMEENKYNVGGNPLGITCQGDNDIFPGTIWVANFSGDDIGILEPNDFADFECFQPGDAEYDANADYDNDGFSNDDEVQNNTDLCSNASTPPDFDGDNISDLLDPDDDNDGIIDLEDPLQLGEAFDIPVVNEFRADDAPFAGYDDLGITGFMNNGTTSDWNTLFDLDDPRDILGGTAGIITMIPVDQGDAFTNNQRKGFQYGVNVDSNSDPFSVVGQLGFPFLADEAGESAGFFIGDGFQDDYIKVVLGNNKTLFVEGESGGSILNNLPASVELASLPVEELNIVFKIEPSTGSIQLLYSVDQDATLIPIGTSFQAGGNLLSAIQSPTQPLVVGLIGTSNGDPNYLASFDFLNVIGNAPFLLEALPNVDRPIDSPSESITLSEYFDDDGGKANLSFEITNNTNPNIIALINGETLQLNFPSTEESAEITIRATDGDNLFAEATFSVNVSENIGILYRVNAGGAEVAAIDEELVWSADTGPSAYLIAGGGNTFPGSTGLPAFTKDASVPLSTPDGVFGVERWDPPAAPEMLWSFPVEPGTQLELRLYFNESFTGVTGAGQRVFDVSVEGVVPAVFNDIDVYAIAGGLNKGIMLSYTLTTGDNSLDIEFIHGVENPNIKAIEILGVGAGSGTLPLQVASISNQNSQEGDEANIAISASGGDNVENFAYVVTGLPAGVDYDPTNGLIFGTIAEGSSANSPYQVEVTVSKPSSTPVSTSFTWQVNDPVIITPGEILYRVNAGGALLSDPTKDWEADQSTAGANGTATTGSPSPFLNITGAAEQDLTFGAPATSVIANNTAYPTSLFLTERYNTLLTPDNMQWDFPVADGDYIVNLLFAEAWTGAQEAGIRTFDVEIEGQLVLDDFDQTLAYGWSTAGVETFNVTVSDGNLDIDFTQVLQNPNLKGIEIISAEDGGGEVTDAWIDKDENESYTGRHECSFVQAGNKFYLLGGRENAQTPEIYDFNTNTWSAGNVTPPYINTEGVSNPPTNLEFNHYQATEYNGLIWIIGAFKNNKFPNELPAEYIYMYDPANDQWIQGPEIPENRRRGSAGLAVYNDKFYIVGGNTIGHNGGYVTWFDEFDPATGIWTPLGDAPNARDHFHAAVIGNKLYAVGGRLSGGPGGTFAPLIAEVDVYDFDTQQWSQAPNLPTPRAASGTVNFQNKLFVMGGEIGTDLNGNVVNDALAVTEAYDPLTNEWTTKAPLNFKRHGTQAIVSGNGIYVAAGSPKQGGGTQKNMEVYGQDNAQGVPSVASSLNVPESIQFEANASQSIELSIEGGNQGMYIRSIQLIGKNSEDFSFDSGALIQSFLKAGAKHNLEITFNSEEIGKAAAILIEYNKQDSKSIILYSGDEIVNPFNEAPIIEGLVAQSNVEGETVSLTVNASDTESNTLNFTASNLPPGISIDSNTGLISGTLPIAEPGTGGVPGAFKEDNGLAMIEIESADIVPGWVEGTDASITYYEGSANSFSNPNSGVLNYQLEINTPGVYRFNWKSKINEGTSATEANDSWLKLPNDENVWFFGYKGGVSSEQQLIDALQGTQANIVFPKGSSRISPATTPEGSGSAGFFKAYMNSTGNWPWQAKTSDNDAHNIYVWFVNPGTYTVQVSNRSAGHAVDRMAFYKVDTYGSNYSTTNLNNAPESAQNDEGVAGNPGSEGIYNVALSVSDDGDPVGTTTEYFTWIVNNEAVTGSNPAAEIAVNPAAGIGASTFGGNSLQITNTGDLDIISLELDISSNFLPDIVFDPTGTAGDAAAKCLAPGTLITGTPGYISPTDPCLDPFRAPQNGVDGEDGFNIIRLEFDDFNGGEQFSFGVDIDPNSIKTDVTAGDAGSVSGFELIGAKVKIVFRDGSEYTTTLWEDGSLGGAKASFPPNPNLAAPSISLEDLSPPFATNDVNQSLTINGTPGATISLLQVDARLYIDAGGGGYDIDPFEANTAVALAKYTVTLDENGQAVVPVSLLLTLSTDAGPNGGLNHFMAVETDANGQVGPSSNVIVIEYDPSLQDPASLAVTANLEARSDHSATYTLELFSLSNLTSPLISSELLADASGAMNLENIPAGTYKIRITCPGHLQKVLEVELAEGANTLDFGSLLAGDVNGDNLVDTSDYEQLQAIFFKISESEGFNPIGDFDGNGVINLNDFNYLKANYETSGETLNN